jgi:uncharacterized protein YecE (DUF72 family)
MRETPKRSAGLYVGTSGWAYPTWKPDFYPADVKQKDFLRYYATQLNATEVNYTFRHIVSEKALTQWIADTPADFRFVLKAHNAITHIRRLKNAEGIVERFCTSLQSLSESGRMGPVFFQLPPNFKADFECFRDFLALLPPGLKHAWEFRHASWFADETYKLLQSHNGSLCIAESEKLETPEQLIGDFVCYRFRKPEYNNEQINKIGDQLGKAAQAREVYAFFKHEENPQGAVWAKTALDVGRKSSNNE